MAESTQKPLKLNLGCGTSKIKGYVNIDAEASVKPDVVLSLKPPALPYRDNSVSEILLFHVIEHIEEIYHDELLAEFARVLKVNGRVYITYPEFKRIAYNYVTNFQGKREFWKATIYGRQLYPGDYHISLMDTELFVRNFQYAGLQVIKVCPESAMEPYNTLVVAKKLSVHKKLKTINYEDSISKEVWGKIK